MKKSTPMDQDKEPFNYAIWLYDMNADDVFDEERHLIIDSSLGVIEEDDANDLPHDSASLRTGH